MSSVDFHPLLVTPTQEMVPYLGSFLVKLKQTLVILPDPAIGFMMTFEQRLFIIQIEHDSTALAGFDRPMNE